MRASLIGILKYFRRDIRIELFLFQYIGTCTQILFYLITPRKSYSDKNQLLIRSVNDTTEFFWYTRISTRKQYHVRKYFSI